MGGPTRLKFPLPHRRPKKQPSQEVQSISAPMTNKAQKFLGSAEICLDNASSPTSPADNSKIWETHSAISGVSGISITISETTAAASVPATAESIATAGPRGRAQAAWDQESDIIPKGLNLNTSSAARSQNLDVTTDASSLRRRRSSSTIVSYYDKSKLPLSISQQTSNSAMAKGLPGKASEVLDMTCPRPAPKPPTMHKKKPSRLDLSHLLPTSATSRLSRFSQKGKDNMNLVLGSDLFTRSPSVMSTQSAASHTHSHSGFEPKPEKATRLRKKLTKESLRNLHSPRWNSLSSETNSATTTLRKRATDTGSLNHLYEHYEQTSFRDVIDQDEVEAVSSGQPSDAGSHPDLVATSQKKADQSATTSPMAPTSQPRHHHVSPSFSSVAWRPFPAHSSGEASGPLLENPRVSVTSSNLASPAGDYSASVSSRHTRTSRASKTTESFADFDPNATSVLSLSSDSEDDDPEPPRTAASMLSAGSRDSIVSSNDHCRRPSNTSSVSVDPARSQPKSRFRSSLGAQAPFLTIPEDDGAAASSSLSINPRSSSLSSAITSNNSPRPSVSTTASSVRSQSRLSQASMSTAESVPTHFSRPRPSAKASSPQQPPEIRHIAMLQSRTVTPTPRKQEIMPEKHQQSPLTRLSVSPRRSQPTPPMSPSSMDVIMRGQYRSNSEQDGPLLTLSGADTASEERFMSVTRQEEMLLAAMRAKRALMRESLQAGDTGASEGSKAASKKESLSSIKTVKAVDIDALGDARSSHVRKSSRKLATALHFPEPPSSKAGSARAALRPKDIMEVQEDVLVCMDRNPSAIEPYDVAEPSPDLSDFIIDFDAERFPDFPAPPKTSHSRNSSTASAAGRLTHPKPRPHHRQSSFGRPRPDSEFLPEVRPASPEVSPPLPFHHSLGIGEMAVKAEQPSGDTNQSMLSTKAPEDEIPQLTSRKKAVRISAVGLQLPEVGQWGDDG